MPRYNYTAAEYTDMILIYGECHGNASLALRTYRERFGNTRVCPTNHRTIVQAVQRIRENKSLIPNTDSAPTRVNNITEQQILNYFAQNPTFSLRRVGRHFRVDHKTVHKVLKREKLKAYKYKKVHAMLSRDKPVREAYCRWMLGKVEQDPDFLYNVMWTDESTFTRNGLWNRQNLRYWSRENPHLRRETSHQYRFAVNVWAGIHRNTIVGPVFIDGSMNGQKFLELLRGPVSEYMDSLSLNAYRHMWYQLDGAPPHSVVPVRAYLNNMFGEQWIGRYGPSRWPARSPDLTPLDFFLWGYIKNYVYASEIETVDDLKNRIIRSFNKLKNMAAESDLLTKVRNNILKRYELCVRVHGGHIENLKI